VKYFEISPLICEKTAIFPGDQSFERKIALDFKAGQHLLLSSISTTLHIGAHADSSSHYHKNGQGIDKREIKPYLGLCQVIHLALKGREQIQISHLKNTEILAPRVVFATNTFPDPNKWQDDFASFSPEVLNWLADQNVILVGIDTPSVDPSDSKSLDAHQVLFNRNLCVLEGLVLSHVPAGVYTLIALPLLIAGADASPVRAILIDGQI
jgi:arylformamidase